MQKEITNIIRENKKRNDTLFPEYNPLTGQGSPIERFKFRISKDSFIMLTKTMLDIPQINFIHSEGGLHKIKKTQKEVDKFYIDLYKLRQKHDFEYWTYICIKILDKKTKKYIQFRLRAAQRKLLYELEKLRLAHQPIRIILLKARQWGGSTLVQIYMMWIQTQHKQNWHSVIGTDVQSQANNIRSMYKEACSRYPKNIGKLTMKPFEGGVARQITERGCRIYLGSMQNPDSLRSGDYAMAHFSEVAIWKTTDNKKPEDVISSVSSSILSDEYTIIVEESTAKGEGNYFHSKWVSSVKGENGFVPVFVAWFEIEIYQKQFKTEEEKIQFAENLSQKGKELWTIGATLEGINWYFEKQYLEKLQNWQMQEEYPSTADEAFITSGERVIPLNYIQKAQATIRNPIAIGNILADGQRGKEALTNIRFETNDATGKVKIWKFPDKENEYTHRYIVIMDIGGRSAKADKTVIRVIDRYWRAFEGVDEMVLTWRGNIDADLGVWIGARIAKWYDNALLVVESNTIDSKHQHTEGDHTYTVFDEIAEFYSKLYIREDPQKTKEGLEPKYGFHTNRQTKTAIINNLIAAYRDEEFIEHDLEMISESNQYEFKPDGTMGAKEGCYDDVLMTTAIGLFVSNKEPLPTLKSSGITAVHVSSIV